MSKLRDLLPGFKLINVPNKGFRVECLSDCYEARQSGWKRTAATLPTIPAARVWAAEHRHGWSLAGAKAECQRLSAQRLADQLSIDIRSPE